MKLKKCRFRTYMDKHIFHFGRIV